MDTCFRRHVLLQRGVHLFGRTKRRTRKVRSAHIVAVVASRLQRIKCGRSRVLYKFSYCNKLALHFIDRYLRLLLFGVQS